MLASLIDLLPDRAYIHEAVSGDGSFLPGIRTLSSELDIGSKSGGEALRIRHKSFKYPARMKLLGTEFLPRKQSYRM